MARTIAILTPFSAEFPTTNYPELRLVNRRPTLGFDATTDETCYWTLIAPQGITTPLTLVITYMMASATTGNVVFQAALEAVTDGDATDLDNVTSFDTTNGSAATAVPAVAGYIDQISVTLTNNDTVAAADYLRLALNRDANHASDTATGDAYVLACELRDSA